MSSRFGEELSETSFAGDFELRSPLSRRAIVHEYDAVKVFNASGSPMILPYRASMQPRSDSSVFLVKEQASRLLRGQA
jgi:hypothetical protein